MATLAKTAGSLVGGALMLTNFGTGRRRARAGELSDDLTSHGREFRGVRVHPSFAKRAVRASREDGDGGGRT